MLHDFVTTNRDAVLARAREKVTLRPWPPPVVNVLENGTHVFLNQLSDTLEAEASGRASPPTAIGTTATCHGRDLLALGFTASEVVHDYGDVCQAVTELAVELHAPITTEEFQTLDRCLGTAIAEAVTEHARITACSRDTEEVERLGQLTHEIRNMLNSAVLALGILETGTVPSKGSIGALLGRSLVGLADLVDSTLADVRMAANYQWHERVSVAAFLNEIAVAGSLHAEYHRLQFAIEPVDPAWAVHADPQLLASAVMSLLNDAFKSTRAGGGVVLRARAAAGRLLIEVEDGCGGIPEADDGRFHRDRPAGKPDSYGLAVARRSVGAHGGNIHIRTMPGKGCVFVIEVQLAVEDAPFPSAVAT